MTRRLAAFALIVSLIFTTLLTGCKKDDSVPSPTSDVSSQTEQSLIPYKTILGNYEVKLPSDWLQETDKSNIRVTESNTGSYITIIKEDYFPAINNYNQDYLAQTFQREGTTLQSYAKEKGNVLKIIISYTTNNVPITEYKYMLWSYESVYYINYIAETKYSEQFIDIYQKVYQSFSNIKEEKTIPEGYACTYNEGCNMSIEYPTSWAFSSSGSGFTVSNSNTTSSITVETAQVIPDFKEYTQIDYNQILQSFAQGASLTSFKNTGETIYGSAYYAQDNQKYVIENVLADNGTYTLILTFVSPSSNSQMDEGAFAHMLESIVYYNPAEPQQTETTAQTSKPLETQPSETSKKETSAAASKTTKKTTTVKSKNADKTSISSKATKKTTTKKATK